MQLLATRVVEEQVDEERDVIQFDEPVVVEVGAVAVGSATRVGRDGSREQAIDARANLSSVDRAADDLARAIAKQTGAAPDGDPPGRPAGRRICADTELGQVLVRVFLYGPKRFVVRGIDACGAVITPPISKNIIHLLIGADSELVDVDRLHGVGRICWLSGRVCGAAEIAIEGIRI